MIGKVHARVLGVVAGLRPICPGSESHFLVSAKERALRRFEQMRTLWAHQSRRGSIRHLAFTDKHVRQDTGRASMVAVPRTWAAFLFTSSRLRAKFDRQISNDPLVLQRIERVWECR